MDEGKIPHTPEESHQARRGGRQRATHEPQEVANKEEQSSNISLRH